MEDAIDNTRSPGSPEELAIHFLTRHMACRRALIEQAGTGSAQRVLAHPPCDTVTAGGVGPRLSAVPARETQAATSEVTRQDSCVARFLQAYAAARHKPTFGRASAGSTQAGVGATPAAG